MKVLDLSQDFSIHTPAFAGYDGPQLKWVKRLAFNGAGGQEITTTLHVGTHLDAPAHFLSGGKYIGDLPLDFLTDVLSELRGVVEPCGEVCPLGCFRCLHRGLDGCDPLGAESEHKAHERRHGGEDGADEHE